MNRLKYLFTYTIVVVIALTSNACKEDIPLTLSQCKSNCFEIRGTLWNASSNKAETNRRINVSEWTDGTFSPDKEYGYVVTDNNGQFVVRLNKSDILDTADLSIVLKIDEKAGYMNGHQFLEISPMNYDLDEVNEVVIDVYEEASLNINVQNNNNIDSVYLFEIIQKFRPSYTSHVVMKYIKPSNNYFKLINTAAGLKTEINVRYKLKNDANFRSYVDSIVCDKNQINNLTFDLK